MSFLSSLAGSVLKGGLIKKLGKKVVKGLKGSAGKIVKGIKRGGVKVVRGIKKGVAQIKELPTAIAKGKQLSGAFKNMPLKDRIINVSRVINNQLKQAGKKALSKDSAERLSKSLVKVVEKANVNKSLTKMLKNARKSESFLDWGGRNLSNLTGSAKKAVQNLMREGAENIAVDKSLSTLGKIGLGLGSSAVGGATTAVIIDKKK